MAIFRAPVEGRGSAPAGSTQDRLRDLAALARVRPLAGGDVPGVAVTTGLSERFVKIWELNSRQLRAALRDGKSAEALETVLQLGELCGQRAEFKELWLRDFGNDAFVRGLIRRKMLHDAFPNIFGKIWERFCNSMRDAFSFRKPDYSVRNPFGFARYLASSIAGFLLDLTSIPSWASAAKKFREAQSIPSPDSMREGSKAFTIAALDSAFAVLMAYLVFDFARDLRVEVLNMADAGIAAVLTFSRKIAWNALGKTVAIAAADEIRRLELAREERANSLLKTLQVLIAVIEAKDEYTRGHSEQVAEYSEWIAREMGLSEELVAKIRLAATLHDIGKIYTPDTILYKPGKLTTEEFEIMKQHPEKGFEFLKRLFDDPVILDVARFHHEKFNGAGYPSGLEENGIPLAARIAAVADVFDAITSKRQYTIGSPSSPQHAIDILKRDSGTHFDPQCVEAFERACKRIGVI